MRRALQLATRGLGRTTPNPIVGAVVVDSSGTIVGQGAHLGAGLAHAEVIALDAAGAKAAGGTLYCTLEPCSHTGRTGPCVERIVAAGIARVVAALGDPNPLVNGAGFRFLRAHGIEVVEDVCARTAMAQNVAFVTWVTLHRPFVTLKIAVSADGFVGRHDAPIRISGPVADRWSQRQRASVDAIAVGSATVLVDDPQLTARGAFRHRPLTRVVFDWRGRVPIAARLFSTLDAGPVIMIGLASEWASRRDRLEFDRMGIVVELFESRNLQSVVERLAKRDVQSLLVEGGPTLHDAFGQASLIDRVQRIVAPRALGSGIPEAAATRYLESFPQVVRTRLGDDELWEADVYRTD